MVLMAQLHQKDMPVPIVFTTIRWRGDFSGAVYRDLFPANPCHLPNAISTHDHPHQYSSRFLNIVSHTHSYDILR